ncbi:hypothetical protein DFP72DRAFT_858180 [Ephemerocybe angulata]|uniref:Uncharacterized protein n=1 Tax=Ephemerocybe angulata TaxID=980116 RepID=A0A8H6HBH8_9AGAR|nr:hypothetical protein DFP72DRAFT_858180 [Tulosesus angulatus]
MSTAIRNVVPREFGRPSSKRTNQMKSGDKVLRRVIDRQNELKIGSATDERKQSAEDESTNASKETTHKHETTNESIPVPEHSVRRPPSTTPPPIHTTLYPPPSITSPTASSMKQGRQSAPSQSQVK